MREVRSFCRFCMVFCGTQVTLDELNPPLVLPKTEHAFVVRRLADQAPWVIGRAGMMYRDLVPSRLGGAMIASHIRIPDGGPVPDMVHFHRVGFQLIFCIKGWVDVLYEDQGGPIRLHAGDCFIQPPEIRHRVLEASDGIEVIEIGVPAEHVTEIDHDMTLTPTGNTEYVPVGLPADEPLFTVSIPFFSSYIINHIGHIYQFSLVFQTF